MAEPNEIPVITLDDVVALPLGRTVIGSTQPARFSDPRWETAPSVPDVGKGDQVIQGSPATSFPASPYPFKNLRGGSR